MTSQPAPSPDLDLVVTIQANISPPVVVGDSDCGRRQFIPITGGHFNGPLMTGEVLPGGADWQLLRADGVNEIEAHYSIRTDDGVVIVVRNMGLADRSGARADAPYLRAAPRFHAPAGRYEWLNRSLFVSTITPAPDSSHVVVRVYQVS